MKSQTVAESNQLRHWKAILNLPSCKRLRKNELKMWEKIRKSQFQPHTFDLTDRFGNTPLHMSALKNCPKTTDLLMRKFKCSIDLRNKFGYSARHMGNWHRDVRAVFTVYLESFEKAPH